MRLRQGVLAARELESAVERLCGIFGIRVAYRDPGVEVFGLRNAVLPVGDTFLEVVSPLHEETAASRFLARRGGDGGYMVLVQVDDLEAARRRVDRLGVRVVWEGRHEDIHGIHLHPRDVGGAILSLDQARPPESWRWAGAEWRAAVAGDVVRELVGVEIRARDPRVMAERWSLVLDRQATDDGEAGWAIPLDRGRIRFVPASDGEEGVGGFDVTLNDRAALRRRAGELGVPVIEDRLELCGAVFRCA
jgi:hypothetical protein